MFQGHGDDGYRHDQPIKADFSTNVWYGGAPQGLREHLFAQWDKVQHYPEVLAESLGVKIASHHGYKSDHVLVANGSTESIYLIAQAFKSKRTAIAIPAFAEYEDACRMFDHEISFVNWQDIENGRVPDTDLLFICNPNNPTGVIIRNLELLISRNINTLFVVDEAFIEFTFSFTSIIELAGKYDNLIVLRSMTKVYSIPGLRLGYIVAQPKLIDLLRSCKLPWAVNVMAIEAGHFIFDHIKDISIPLKQLQIDKELLIKGIAELGIKVWQSNTHFFLAETPIFNAAKLKQYLLKNHDLLIRDAGNFRGLEDNFFRIATLSAGQNNLLINALSQWIRTSL